MPISPPKSKEALLDHVLALLWRQWSLLGVPGHATGRTEPPTILDPEALLLATSRLARFDPRLFAEVLHWLGHFGKLISIQRLKTLHELTALGEPRELSALAAAVQQNSRLAKWRSIEELSQPRPGRESLFRQTDGTDYPLIGPADPAFARFGFFRALPKTRPKSSKRDLETALAAQVARHPELLLIKLRALLGINARAEIIAALLTQPSAHPAQLAESAGYLARSVQDTLNEMTLSGLLIAHRAPGSREKHFALRPSDWAFLRSWPEPAFPAWINWGLLFALLQDVVATWYRPELNSASPLKQALQLRGVFDRHLPGLARAGLAGRFLRSTHATGLEFLEAFTEELMAF